MDANSRLYIVDGYGFVFRAYHVQPPLTAPDGTPVGALYGFASMLLKMVNEFRPDKIIVVFDSGAKNLRHEIYPEYKANRPPAPEDLKLQLPLVREVATSLGFPTIEHEGYEADDVIATLVETHSKHNLPTTVISSDKDLMQLIDGDMVRMYDPLKSRMVTEEVVQEKFGITSNQMHDFLSLVGDNSDNIPGIPGVGPKTASLLLEQFGSLENILANIDKIEKPRFAKLMQEHADKAKLSWKLAELHRDVPIDLEINKLHWVKQPSHEVLSFLQKYGFKSLEARCAKIYGAPDKPTLSTPTVTPDKPRTQYQLLDAQNKQQIEDYLSSTREYGYLAFYYQESEHTLLLSTGNNTILSINLAPDTEESAQGQLFNTSSQSSPYFAPLIEIFADSSVQKITYDHKQICHQLSKLYGKSIEIVAVDDVMLMEYALKSGTHSKDLSSLLDVYGVVNNLPEAIGELYNLHTQLKGKLIEHKLYRLYKQIDLPISYLLHKMENNGFRIDADYLKLLSSEIAKKIAHYEEKIFQLAGEEFNIASTKQLAEILFDKLQLPAGKVSSKSKTPSTSAEVLEKLSEAGYEIADHLLHWRQLTKLKNTYTDALPQSINPTTGRVHTTFLQTSTSTSRLSSIEPNLQNIPIRTEEGAKIRKAFVSSAGYKLIFADYSQIELRILSQIAGIKELQEAFASDQDIHSKTASQIFNIPIEDITPELRYKAKAINFGIIYGISAFGLAKQLGISRSDATSYIENYFLQYPGIKEYMENTKAFAAQHGFVENLFGRKLYIPLINNKNHALKSFAQRAAINAPIQGTAADIAKLAMLESYQSLKQRSLNAKMLLQVHDELIFEVAESEVDDAHKLIKSSMQNCAAGYFTIPLKVDININDNWAKT